MAAGREFLGLPTIAGPVLYVDTELDPEEFTRRAYAVARGLGLSRPPAGVFYYRPEQSLAREGAIAGLQALRAEVGARLVVVDSLTLGAWGADLSAPDAATTLLHGLRTLGTTLALDHIPKPAPGANLSGYRPFGSQMKWAQARCTVQVLRAPSGEGVVLRPAKNNFAALGGPLAVRVSFAGDKITFAAGDIGAEDFAGAEEDLPRGDQVFAALARCGEVGATAEELAAALGLRPGTLRNWLTVLRKQGRAESDGRRWRVTPPALEWAGELTV